MRGVNGLAWGGEQALRNGPCCVNTLGLEWG